MTAILRRELNAYFSSPIGYIYLTVIFLFSGLFFSLYSLYRNTTDLTGVFSNLFMIVIFLVPVLTMRLLSEDNKNRTDQALLTAPISLTGLVLGKFLAALAVYAIGLSITLIYTVIVAYFAPPNYALIFGNFAALLLMGAALIAIGMFISSLTENQVIAAVGGFAVGLGLMLVDALTNVVNNEHLVSFIHGMSFTRRYYTFTSGIFDFSGVVFFLSVCAIFIFLTVRVLERRRWS